MYARAWLSVDEFFTNFLILDVNSKLALNNGMGLVKIKSRARKRETTQYNTANFSQPRLKLATYMQRVTAPKNFVRTLWSGDVATQDQSFCLCSF